MESTDGKGPPPSKFRKVGRKNEQRKVKGESKRNLRAQEMIHALENCQYYHDAGGLRRVKPYIYEFKTHAKARWLGKSIIDVFGKEFCVNSKSHYQSAIRAGHITVNGEKTEAEYKLRSGDLVCNRLHRHEPPVVGGDINIVLETETEMVVNKPPTIPVHPCGSYRFNSLFYILQQQRPGVTLRVCHRLDRLTSGLTIFAKTAERANEIQSQIGSGETKKVYLARVSGDFGQNLSEDRRWCEHTGQGIPPTRSEVQAHTKAVKMHQARLKSIQLEGNQEGTRGETVVGQGTLEREEAGDGKVMGKINRKVVSPDEDNPCNKKVVSPDEDNPCNKKVVSPDEVNPCNKKVVSLDEVNPCSMWWRMEGDAVGSSSSSHTTVRVSCPIRLLEPKNGVYGCHGDGKSAETVFCRRAYDLKSDTSLVECYPVHGRTHQIRLHLQWVGHPIANDPCYGGDMFFGDPEAKDKTNTADLPRSWNRASDKTTCEGAGESPSASGNVRSSSGASDIVNGKGVVQDDAGNVNDGAAEVTKGEGRGGAERDLWEGQRPGEDDNAFMERMCQQCQGGENFKETQLHCHGIWLHALRYQGKRWSFETEPPAWSIL
ncbi:unnamed protein product [Discosporangium mesarthrocarpum]